MGIGDMMIGNNCKHAWVANSGRGGEPVFRTNRAMSVEPLMHVLCSACNTRTWFTGSQWRSVNGSAGQS